MLLLPPSLLSSAAEEFLCDALSLLVPCERGFGGEVAVWGEQEPRYKAVAGLECVCDSELKTFVPGERGRQ